MKTKTIKSYWEKESTADRKWILINAEGKTLGRLATRIAMILRGKHKATYTPTIDMGDFVVVTNAEKIHVTGKKLKDKFYYHYSGYQSGLKKISLQSVLAKHPDRAIRMAVDGMLPKNRMRKVYMKKLKVFAGAEHTHQAQQPQEI